MKINFNEPYFNEDTFKNINLVLEKYHIASGDGVFTKKCHEFLTDYYKAKKTLLVNSCTAALEMCALLLNIKENDEVIMPSYTFVTTANAFVLRGAKPVFVDINPNTLCIDEGLIEAAITPKTKAIIPVHYAGISCDLDRLENIVKSKNIPIIEDAAQAIGSKYKNKLLGTFGELSALSFHETKNISSGEGGALIINDEKYSNRAEILREKGTNRKQFLDGQVDKYSWVDIGSSFLPSDIIAACLYSQLDKIEMINKKRNELWYKYYNSLKKFENSQKVKLPIIPEYMTYHNAHIFYLLFNDKKTRNYVMNKLKDFSINSIFHYIPLHSSVAGQKYGRCASSMNVTDKVSDTILRLPLFYNLLEEQQDYVIEKLSEILEKV